VGEPRLGLGQDVRNAAPAGFDVVGTDKCVVDECWRLEISYRSYRVVPGAGQGFPGLIIFRGPQSNSIMTFTCASCYFVASTKLSCHIFIRLIASFELQIT
jgi:hypothetical protein